MDCERFDKITLELLYDELDELSAAAARRHLHHCSRCQAIWNQFRATKEVTELPLEEPPSDLFQTILEAERVAYKELSFRERASRIVSVMAGYAMRPQLAMAAILLLMIGSSLLFVRQDPSGRGKVRITELGAPRQEPAREADAASEPLVVEGDAIPTDLGARAESTLPEGEPAAPEPMASYAEAMSAYHEGRYAEAERLFAEVAAAGGEKSGTAALHRGHAARNGSGCQRASELYDSVAEKYAGTSLGEEASWHAASCYQALGQLSRARSHYVALKDSAAFGERSNKAVSTIDEQVDRTKIAAAQAGLPGNAPTSGAPADAGELAGDSGVARASNSSAAKPASAKTEGDAAPPTTERSPDDEPSREDLDKK